MKGLLPLREAIAEFNFRNQGIKCSANDIIIGPGSKELIFILQLVYYGELIIPTPSWVSYSPQARIAGRHVNWVPTSEDNDWRLSPEKLDLICRSDPNRPRVVILNYPSNPTGSTYPKTRLKKLADVAILPGIEFGRQPEELACRMAYVNFDGELVLNKARSEYRGQPITEEFLKTHCKKMVDATSRLEEWLSALQ